MDFIVIRHGANAANQSMCERMAVAIILNADSHEHAANVSHAYVGRYANQWLEQIPAANADPDEWNTILEFHPDESRILDCNIL